MPYFVALVFAIVTLLSTQNAEAQCSFQQAGKAKKYVASLVAAFPENPPTTTHVTADGIPSIAPPLTFTQIGGPYLPIAAPQVWFWDPTDTYGRVTIQMQPMAKMFIRIQAKGIRDIRAGFPPAGSPFPAISTGELHVRTRITLSDLGSSTDRTAVDYVSIHSVIVTGGQINAVVNADSTLDGTIPLELTECSSVEILSIELRDGLGNVFAVAGLHVDENSSAPASQCDFQRPREKRAKSLKSDMVPMYSPCSSPNGNIDNDPLAVAACDPPLPEPTGWSWSTKTRGALKLATKRSGGTNGPLANGEVGQAGDVGDVCFQVKVAGIFEEDGTTPASTSGALRMTWRFTTSDRNFDDMTLDDMTLTTPAIATKGKVKIKSCLNDILNGLGLHDLPGCATAELVDIQLRDDAATPFATVGVRGR